MEIALSVVDFILNIDKHLTEIVRNYGVWTYSILFLIVFCETGLVVAPFLPGDSLLFVVGALSAKGAFEIGYISIILLIAAILGDTVNYHIGKYIGPKIFQKENVKLLNKEHLEKAYKFYEKHGGKTIIIARFIPIIRTFAPFVGGIGKMNYARFITYNIVGAISWVMLFVMAGYFFGNIPLVRDNFTLVVMAIIFISILPAVITFLKNKLTKTSEAIK